MNNEYYTYLELMRIYAAFSIVGIYDSKKNEFVDENLWPTDTKKIINELRMNNWDLSQLRKNLNETDN